MATAQEKLSELERRKDETLKAYSPASLLQKLQGNGTMTTLLDGRVNEYNFNRLLLY